MNKLDFTYDIECFPNIFTLSIKQRSTGDRWLFEISQWMNQGVELFQFLMWLKSIEARMIGYNNCQYDYMLVHFLITRQGYIDHNMLYEKNQAFFNHKQSQGYNPHVIPEYKHEIKQIDLLKIHHFDNKAKMTALKMLEFNMGSHNIKDLPYPVGTVLTREQADNLIVYNHHDVDETEKFTEQSQPMIDFRDELTVKYSKDFTNYNDTKIGKEYFLMELEKHGIYSKVNGVLQQTKRASIEVKDILLPYINFERPEFQEVLDFFRIATVDKLDEHDNLELKGFFNGVSATLDGFQFDFGAGGIHGSVHAEIVRESKTHDLLDWDVASYYPNLAIANRFFPEHLTEWFCDIYLDVYGQRQLHAKGTPENAMLKLALNGVFGDSNNRFSPFFDSQYTMSITINGQLLLCMLAEQLMKIPNLKMVQINTDGLTFLCPKEHREHANRLWKWWEILTRLELEEAVYQAMYIRDVNNYMALKDNGKVKRIGAYAHETALKNNSTRELAWNKDWSMRVVAKAAEAALVYNENISDFIRTHTVWDDFMLRTKVKRSDSLVLKSPVMWGTDVVCERSEKLQNISRYFVSITGGNLVKIMPPTPNQLKHWANGDHYQHVKTGDYKVVEKGKDIKNGQYVLVPNPDRANVPNRNTRINAGLLVTDCSNMDDFKPELINYDFYINEARKLVDPLFNREV